MKNTNTLVELNTRLFEQLDAITNSDLKGDSLKDELARTDAVINLAKTIISNADVCLKASIARDSKLTVNELPKMLTNG